MPGMLQPERQLVWSEDGQRLMSVTVRSLFTGKLNTMEVGDVYHEDAITRAQWDAWQSGQHIQHAMPQLGPDEREFLMSGATPEEWNAFMKDED